MRSNNKISKTPSRLVLLTALLVAGSSVYGQGLGELVVDSSFNEPLAAHIELLDVMDFDIDQINIELASPEQFEAADLDWNPVLNSLVLEVIATDNGYQVDVSSSASIDEPYLTFLLSASWPGGAAIREYTLLLDLGVEEPTEPPARVSTQSLPAVRPALAGGNENNSGANEGTLEYTIEQGDTLSAIARQFIPEEGVNMQQMMIALQRANEDAFIDNNINRILSGSVLRIPTLEEIEAVEVESARAEVVQQNQSLSNQPLAVNNTPTNSAEPARDELVLLSGDQNVVVQGSSDLDATIQLLQNELMISEEGVDRARLENLELTNRLTSLQEEIELLRNIIAIEDQKIAQLQTELSKQTAAVEPAIATNAASAITPAPAPAPASQQQTNGLLEFLKNSLWWLTGVVVALALVVMGLFARLRQAKLEQEDPTDFIAPAARVEERPPVADTYEEESAPGFFTELWRNLFRRQPEEPEFEREWLPEQHIPIERGAPRPLAQAPAITDEPVQEVSAPVAQAAVQPAPEPEVVAVPLAPVSNLLAGAVPVINADKYGVVPAIVVESPPTPADSAPSVKAASESISTVAAEPSAVAAETALDDFLQSASEPTLSATNLFNFKLPPDLPPAKAEEPFETFSFKVEPTITDAAETVSVAVADDAIVPANSISFDDTALSFGDDMDAELSDEDEVSHLSASGQDTFDARLDLAVAYEAMGDVEGAIEILDEVLEGGNPSQVAEAERLKAQWS